MNFDALFIKWKSKYDFNAFIRDGIVDSEHYDSPHILFVLRDMNCQSELDLCADLRKDGSGWKTWNNISRWTKALLDGTEAYPRSMPKEERVRQISRVAVMNLKKKGAVVAQMDTNWNGRLKSSAISFVRRSACAIQISSFAVDYPVQV